ncbi:Uncharacterised protein [Serratia liquefaciens]|nr:Uncharacterised protein [Serratia liquefaciens]
MDMQETLTLSSYLVLAATLLVAYVIFGIAGFGSALVAGPVMALYIPVAKIVPLLALLDMCAATDPLMSAPPSSFSHR